MSRYRGSPRRSPYRSPPRLYESQRDAIIEDQIRFKTALNTETDFRRLNDDLTMLQFKVRHTNQLQTKLEMLLRQNAQFVRDNDELTRQLNQKRYEIERVRGVAVEQQEREVLRAGQLVQTNKSLQLQVELLKKQRIEGNRLFEAHIQKLERLLDQKVIELDASTLRCSELSKQLELSTIHFEEEKNRLKNVITRTEHERERQLQYTKQKQANEKFTQIDMLKRNHLAQLVLFQDEISKLKGLSQLKTEQFQAQLNENKILRKRHDEQIKQFALENDDLRGRMQKLEELNRSQVQSIKLKYNDYHTQGTSSLKEQHERQIKLLLEQIDKQKWLIGEKNTQIQNNLKQKRQLRKVLNEIQLSSASQIDCLKNKLYEQQTAHNEQNHNLMSRINEITNKSLSDSQAYYQRVQEFNNQIRKSQSEINDKQNYIDKIKKQWEEKQKEFKKQINHLLSKIQQNKSQLADIVYQKEQKQKQFEQYQNKTQAQLKNLHGQLSEAYVKLEHTQQKIVREGDHNSSAQDALKIEIQSLKKTIGILEQKFSEQQRKHAKQMQEYSTNLNGKLKKLQASQKNAVKELEQSRKQQIGVLNLRIEKLNNDKQYAQNQLKKYIQMYIDLEKYFKNPHDGALFQQKSKNQIYQVLHKVVKSSIHIF